MTGSDLEKINRIANFLKVNPGKLNYNHEKVIFPKQIVKKKNNLNKNLIFFKVITRYFNKTNDISDISGFSTIVQSLAKESKEQIIKNGLTDLETQCLVAQWVEYAVLYASSSDKHVTNSLLKELHIYLSTRSYFVGESLTLADLAMYYAIENAMVGFNLNAE